MLLKNHLYHVMGRTSGPQSLTAEVRLCASHPIFDGHFPGQPILPGVCTLQICKELASDHVGQILQLTECTTIKYVKLIEPSTTPTLHYAMTLRELAGEKYRIDAVVTNPKRETVCKLSVVALSVGVIPMVSSAIE